MQTNRPPNEDTQVELHTVTQTVHWERAQPPPTPVAHPSVICKSSTEKKSHVWIDLRKHEKCDPLIHLVFSESI